MEKLIIGVRYWLGILSVLLALLLRAFNILGLSSYSLFRTNGAPIIFSTFLDSAQMFFLAAIATAGYVRVTSQNK